MTSTTPGKPCPSCATGRCHWNPDGGGRQLGDPCTCPDHDRAFPNRKGTKRKQR